MIAKCFSLFFSKVFDAFREEKKEKEKACCFCHLVIDCKKVKSKSKFRKGKVKYTVKRLCPFNGKEISDEIFSNKLFAGFCKIESGREND